MSDEQVRRALKRVDAITRHLEEQDATIEKEMKALAEQIRELRAILGGEQESEGEEPPLLMKWLS